MRGDGSLGYDRSRDKLTYDYYDNAGRHCKKRFATQKPVNENGICLPGRHVLYGNSAVLSPPALFL